MSKVASPPIQALELAAGIVLQHNLLSTATDAERRATIERLLNCGTSSPCQSWTASRHPIGRSR